MSGESALVLVTSSFPISGDGSEAAGAFVADLAGALAGHVPVRVVAPGKANAKEAWAASVEVFRYQAPDRPLSTLRPWHPAEAWQVAGVLRNGALATERAMQAGPVAHVLALWALPCGDWARRSARKHGVGYSAWTLGSDIWSLGRIPLVRTHLRTILRDAQYCWSDGFKLAQDTRAIVGRDVDFLPSTRKMDRVRSGPLRKEPPYRLLFLGRWHPNKGVDLLIEALEELSDADWARIECVTVAGGGPMEPLVRTGVERLRSTGRPVELRGYLNREEAQQAMLDADYLLIPSRIESIPVVFSDAMKLHCPVVAMPVGDLPALLATDPACGVVAQSVTGPGFAAGLRAALRRAPAKFIEGVRLQSQRFDLEMVAQRLATELMDRMPDVAGRGGRIRVAYGMDMKDPESSPLLALDSDRWAEILAGALKADVERSSNGILLATFRRGPFRLAYPEFPVGRSDYPISTVEALCEMAAARRATMIRFHSDERLPSRPAIAPIALGTSRIDDLQSWNESSCKKARRTRNRYLKSPLRIEPAAERDGPMLFELYRLVIERHGGRAKYSAAYFDAIAAESTLVARNDRKIVGFVTIARLGKRAYYLHGAHDPLARSLYPSDLLFRSMILRARSEGAESFDFLPSPAGQPSLRRYKQDWGGAPAPLHVTDVPLRPVLGQVLKLGLRAQDFLSGR